jgi:hypothetical protein
MSSIVRSRSALTEQAQTSGAPMAASRVSKSADMDDFDDPKSTVDALGLLADADSPSD